MAYVNVYDYDRGDIKLDRDNIKIILEDTEKKLSSEEQEQSSNQSKSSLEAFLAGQLEVFSFYYHIQTIDISRSKTIIRNGIR